MSVKLKITVTKEVLIKTAYCSKSAEDRISNCAVAIAVRDIFPDAQVYQTGMMFSDEVIPINPWELDVLFPPSVSWYIHGFDNKTPKERVNMSEMSFVIDIPDDVICQINIDEIRPLLQNHPTLELIEQ